MTVYVSSTAGNTKRGKHAKGFRFSSDSRHFDRMETPEKELKEWIDGLRN